MPSSTKNALNQESYGLIVEKLSAEAQAIRHVAHLVGYTEDSDSDSDIPDVMNAVDEARKNEAYICLFSAIPAEIKSHKLALRQDKYFTEGIETTNGVKTPNGSSVKNAHVPKNKSFTLPSPLTVADRAALSPLGESTPVAKF